MMSASWDPPGVTHDLLKYLKAKSIREESVWGGKKPFCGAKWRV